MRFRLSTCAQLALFIPIALAPVLRAQGGQRISQISGEILTSQKTLIAHTVHPLVRSAVDGGALPADTVLQRMMLMLRPSKETDAALKQFMDDQNNPASPDYRHWLSPKEFGERFGPSNEDVAAVKAWLESEGMTVQTVADGRRWIEFSGSAGQVAHAFGTSLHTYTIHGQRHIANSTDISMPSALVSLTQGLVRLNDIFAPTPRRKLEKVSFGENGIALAKESLGANQVAPNLVNPDGYQFITPGDLQTIYDTSALKSQGLDGTGVSIAVIGRTDVSLDDIRAFRQLFGLPAQDPEVILAGLDPGNLFSGDETESDLDLEYAGAMAPNAAIRFVIAQSTTVADGIDLAAAFAVDHNTAPVLSLSYGLCEAFLGASGNSFYNSLWQQAAAQGISVMVSTGDNGSAGCDAEGGQPAGFGFQVSGIASTPYNTAVGGTQFDASAMKAPFWNLVNGKNFTSAVGYVPETVWSETCDPTLPASDPNYCSYNDYVTSGGSGGKSSCTVSDFSNSTTSVPFTCSDHYVKPSWQFGPGVPVDGARDIPDISLAAASGFAAYVICSEGSCQYTQKSDGSYSIANASAIGGTSAATPAFAGVAALLNQQYGSPQGLLNNKLYRLAAQPSASCNTLSETSPSQRDACVFHDVTTGNNSVPCAGGTPNCLSNDPNQSGRLSGYAAGIGYDLASGLGSIDAANLINTWNSIAASQTKVTFTLTPATGAHGQSQLASGTVMTGSGTPLPAGTLSLKTSTGLSLGAYPIANGVFSSTITNLPGGTYTVIAHFPGDAVSQPSDSAPVSVTITPESSSALAQVLTYDPSINDLSSQSSFAYGSTTYLRVSVGGSSKKGTATGSVNMMMDGVSLGTFALNTNGMVELNTGPQTYPGITLSVGPHVFTALYLGDSSFNPSQSDKNSFTVTKGTVVTNVAGTTYTPNTGQNILLTGFVLTNTPQLPINPTGSVSFYDNGTLIGTGPVSPTPDGYSSGGSQATLFYAFPSAGTHNISAQYSGDSNFQPYKGSYSTEFDVADPVGASVTMSVDNTSTTPVIGQAVTYVINLNGVVPGNKYPPKPSGTVTLSGGTQSFTMSGGNTVPIQYGQAVINTVFTSAGPIPIFFTYSGDSRYASASSTLQTVKVRKATPTASLSTIAPTPMLAGSQAVFKVSLIGDLNSNLLPYPTGFVQFYDSVDGKPAAALGQPQAISIANGPVTTGVANVSMLAVHLSAGVHTVTAVYSGDSIYASVQTVPVVVTAANPDFTLTTPSGGVTLLAASSGSATVQVVPILGFNQAVSLSCSGPTLPTGVQCSINPSTLSGGTGSVVITLTAPAAGTLTSANQKPNFPFSNRALEICSAGVLFCLIRRRRSLYKQLVTVLLLAGLTVLVGCGSVSPSTPSMRLTSSNIVSPSSSAVTFTATVTSANNTPLSAPVYFTADGVQFGSAAALVSGLAQQTSDNLSLGFHPIQARYPGDAKNLPAMSPVFVQEVSGDTSVNVVAVSGSVSHVIAVPLHLRR